MDRASQYFEITLWFAALFYLALHNPYVTEYFSFCPVHHLGFTFCPGCGLGRSISLILHGDPAASWSTHWLGIPALTVIVLRIGTLFRYHTFRRSLLRTQQP